jgi:hypothetical protein
MRVGYEARICVSYAGRPRADLRYAVVGLGVRHHEHHRLLHLCARTWSRTHKPHTYTHTSHTRARAARTRTHTYLVPEGIYARQIGPRQRILFGPPCPQPISSSADAASLPRLTQACPALPPGWARAGCPWLGLTRRVVDSAAQRPQHARRVLTSATAAAVHAGERR